MTRLLPVGTVVKLDTNSEDKYMIFARLAKKSENDSVLWDYCACRVPQGFTNQDNVRFFAHSDIQQLLFIGFQDEEELQYSIALGEIKESSKV